ncbi:MAG: hypothetical protein ACI841_003958 [Planctomycetota bacterium]
MARQLGPPPEPAQNPTTEAKRILGKALFWDEQLSSDDMREFLDNALIDPRVENALPPFDRPSLNSERSTPNPKLIGGSVAGSGGFVPKIIAVNPPPIGSENYKLGVHDGLGKAVGFVTFQLTPPGVMGPARRKPCGLSE